MRKRDVRTLIFNAAVMHAEVGVPDGLPVLAAVILARKPELTRYCFCSYRQDMNKEIKQLVVGRDRPTDLIAAVDALHRQCQECSQPIIARHSVAAYRQLLGLVAKGDSPHALHQLEVELHE